MQEWSALEDDVTRRRSATFGRASSIAKPSAGRGQRESGNEAGEGQAGSLEVVVAVPASANERSGKLLNLALMKRT